MKVILQITISSLILAGLLVGYGISWSNLNNKAEAAQAGVAAVQKAQEEDRKEIRDNYKEMKEIQLDMKTLLAEIKGELRGNLQ